jgi:hypothetical protein
MPRSARPSVEVIATANTFRWSVLWVKPKGGSYTIIRHEYGNDFTEALRVYNKAKAAGKRMATLRSNNVAFPPPEKYQPYRRQKVEVVNVDKYVKRNGVRTKVNVKRKRLVPYTEIPMEKMNLKGWYWCPYCREMRKFQHQTGFPIGEKSFVDAPGMYCPLCGVSHRDFSVRRWNPHAWRMYLTETQPRRTQSTQTSTASRTRQRRTSRRTSST